MITGHLGVAAAVHAARRDSSLPWLLGASIAPDLLDGLFALAGECNPHGLYSHTVPAAALLAAVVGGAAFLATRRRMSGLLAALLVLVHLPLDFITGQKLFWPGGELTGLHLYEYPVADFVLEALVLSAGWWALRRSGRAPRQLTGWPTLALLLALQGVGLLGQDRGGMKPTACAGRPVVPA